jgi:endoglycosylceramidase
VLRRTATAAIAALALAVAPAHASPTPPLGHSGRWITDAHGRVVILHGLNMVYKVPPYAPDASGFSSDDAAFLEREGFNTVRLGLIYAAVEPSPGNYRDAYIRRVRRTERMLARHHIFSLVDFHQDMYNERFQGEGWPDWAVQDDGLPAQPQTGFPGNYVAMPALSHAYDHFWANDPGPGGIGLQDRYAAAWRHVAGHFASDPGVLGYDLFNEPWPGSVWPSCANTAGCPSFDTGTLTPFTKRMVRRIRKADSTHLVFWEPEVLFNFGADTSHGITGDPRTAMSFHVYCLAGLISGAPQSCDQLEEDVFDNADAASKRTNDGLLLSEYGATNDLAVIRRITDDADRHMVSWQEWHYCECGDPTTQGPGIQSIVPDAHKPPRGRNVKYRKLRALSRPYPQAIAGRPLNFFYHRANRTFELNYRLGGVGGAHLPRWLRTEVNVPKRHYPNGYTVDATGAEVVSPPDARILRLVRKPGARKVHVKVISGHRRGGVVGAP